MKKKNQGLKIQNTSPLKKRICKQKDHKNKMLIKHTDLSSTWLNISQSLLKTDNQITPLHYSDTHDFDSKIFKSLCDKC